MSISNPEQLTIAVIDFDKLTGEWMKKFLSDLSYFVCTRLDNFTVDEGKYQLIVDKPSVVVIRGFDPSQTAKLIGEIKAEEVNRDTKFIRLTDSPLEIVGENFQVTMGTVVNVLPGILHKISVK